MSNDQSTGNAGDASIEERIAAKLYPQDKPKNQQQQQADDGEGDQDDDQLNLEGDQDQDQDKGQGDDADQDETPPLELDADQLAEIMGIDAAQLGTNEAGELLVNVKVNGKDSQVPFKDVIKSYQLEQHVNEKSMKLSNLQKEFDQYSTGVKQELYKQHNYNIGVAKLAEDMLLKDFNSIDWAALKSANPQQYAAIRQDYQERAQAIKSLQAQVVKEAMQFAGGLQTEMTEAQKSYFEEQHRLMLIDNPSWSNPAVKEKAQSELRSFLGKRYGFTDADFALVTDRRLLQLIQDAYKYNQGKQNLDQKLKDGKKKPRFVPKGAGFNPQVQKMQAGKADRQALRNSGSVEDAAKILLKRM